MTNLSEQKKALRQKVGHIVQDLSEAYCVRADQAILGHIIALPEYEQAQTIFCYVGRGNEINTLPILQDALHKGKIVGVPKCIGPGIMEVYRIFTLADLEAGKYGIREPRAGMPLIQPEHIDLALVPCLTCNRRGQRLGYGGGYYDRYLASARFVKALLCRARIMQDEIPIEEHDQIIDMVISEEGVVVLK